MSTDMQTAAAWFGCSAMIHVIDNSDEISELKKKDTYVFKWGGKERFLIPFPQKYKNLFTPFIIGSFSADPLSGMPLNDSPGMELSRYPLEYPETCLPQLQEFNKQCLLTREIEERKAKAGFLMCNYANRMLQGETVTNFLVFI